MVKTERFINEEILLYIEISDFMRNSNEKRELVNPISDNDIMDNLQGIIEHLPTDVPTVKIISLGGIPTAITGQHMENYYFWQNLGLQNAVLLTIDAHKDFEDIVKPKQPSLERAYHRDLELNNFICAAVYYGILSSPTFRLNPFEHPKYRLSKVDLEAKMGKQGHYDKIKWNKSLALPINFEGFAEYLQKCKNLLVLDIDLDGFSCMRVGPTQYDGSYDYEERINETIELLKQIKRPDLITITRSQSCFGKGVETYVKPELVNKVEQKAVDELVRLYGEKILLYEHQSTSPTV